MNIVVPIFVLGAGAVAGWLAFLMFRSSYRKISTWQKATGTVVDFQVHQGRRTYYRPRVEFTTPTGECITFTASVGSTRRGRVGRSVRIIYPADNPAMADIRSFMGLWFLPFFLSLFPICFTSIAVIKLVQHYK